MLMLEPASILMLEVSRGLLLRFQTGNAGQEVMKLLERFCPLKERFAGIGLAAIRSYQLSNPELWIAIPRNDNSSSNRATARLTSPSPGTTTAHVRFSRNSRVLMRHCSRAAGVVAPI